MVGSAYQQGLIIRSLVDVAWSLLCIKNTVDVDQQSIFRANGRDVRPLTSGDCLIAEDVLVAALCITNMKFNLVTTVACCSD